MDLEKVINKIVDKSKWKTYRFDELVKNIVEKVVPKGSGLEHYIGLEHLDSGSVHIKRFGETESLIGDKLKIYKGDIIFAKRNAYLKRASISPIDGVASAHSLVLRMNEETVDKRFFPFFLMSEYFWERAIEISVGSLSPTINWKTLAKQEFLLPPKEQQAELADLLWAMDDVIEKDLEVLERLEDYLNSIIGSKIIGEDFTTDKIEYFFKEKYILGIQDGNHGELHPKASDYVNEGIPFVMANTISKGKIDFDKAEKLPKSLTDKLRIGFAKEKDVLLSHKGTIGNVGFIENINGYEYVMLTPQVTYYRVNENKLNPKYLFYYFQSQKFKNLLNSLSSQSTRSYIGIQAQQKLEISIPNSVKTQNEIVEELDDLSNMKLKLESKLQASKTLQKALINQIF